MERTRANLSQKLHQILGSNNVYFQPPNGTSIKYPCIIYHLEDDETFRADNINYVHNNRYTIRVIDKNPDSTIYKRLMDEFDHCSLDRKAISDNLNHWYMTLYW